MTITNGHTSCELTTSLGLTDNFYLLFQKQLLQKVTFIWSSRNEFAVNTNLNLKCFRKNNKAFNKLQQQEKGK